MMRIGIVGCGNIASTLAPVMNHYPGVMRIEAAASRSKEKAEEFASRFSIGKAYGSYEELYEDADVDIVYVATPHSHHKEIMLDALNHGKHILCEKAFCVNATEAREVFALAKEKNLYVAEAIWTRYMPSRKMIKDIIDSDRIGEVKSITANLGYTIIQKPRISEPSLAGGALLDVGVYPLNFTLMAMEGTPVSTLTGTCVKTEKGVDERSFINITFKSGAQASVYSEACCVTDRKGIIYGTNGHIEVTNVNNPEKIEVFSGDRNPVLLETIEITHEVNGYEYELLSAANCIAEGKIEDPHMPWSETLRVLTYTDALREIWKIKLASELEG